MEKDNKTGSVQASEKIVTVVAVVILAIILLMYLIGNTPENTTDIKKIEPPSQKEEMSDYEVKHQLEMNGFSISKIYLKSTVNDEGSFDAPHIADNILHIDKRTVLVASHFTAKNVFNATVKTKYRMILKYNGKLVEESFSDTRFWEIERLYINGERVK